MDTAMYWINYVIEHRGAPHLVAAGVELPWYQFYLLDIVALAFALIILSIIAVILICRLSSYKSKNPTKEKAKSTWQKTK